MSIKLENITFVSRLTDWFSFFIIIIIIRAPLWSNPLQQDRTKPGLQPLGPGAPPRWKVQNSALSLRRLCIAVSLQSLCWDSMKICPLTRLTEFCEHGQLWQPPVRCCLLAATSYMCYSYSLVQEFPERGPGPTGVTQREEGEGESWGSASSATSDVLFLHCNLIQQYYHRQT